MDRRVTSPKRVISPIWGPPPPCKQALNKVFAIWILLLILIGFRFASFEGHGSTRYAVLVHDQRF